MIDKVELIASWIMILLATGHANTSQFSKFFMNSRFRQPLIVTLQFFKFTNLKFFGSLSPSRTMSSPSRSVMPSRVSIIFLACSFSLVSSTFASYSCFFLLLNLNFVLGIFLLRFWISDSSELIFFLKFHWS